LISIFTDEHFMLNKGEGPSRAWNVSAADFLRKITVDVKAMAQLCAFFFAKIKDSE